MEIDCQKSIDDAVFKKLNKLTINEIRIVINQLQLKYKRAYSNSFYHEFVMNVKKANDSRIRNLYIDQLNQDFSQPEIDQLQILADKYQKNQLNQAIRKHVNHIFDEAFKADLQALIYQIAQETMQTETF